MNTASDNPKTTELSSWQPRGVGCVETPFNIEAILRACPALYECWRKRPFYLTQDAAGHLLVRFMDDDIFATGGAHA